MLLIINKVQLKNCLVFRNCPSESLLKAHAAAKLFSKPSLKTSLLNGCNYADKMRRKNTQIVNKPSKKYTAKNSRGPSKFVNKQTNLKKQNKTLKI